MSFVSTSRVGRKPVAIPAGVEVSVAGLDLAIRGPKGSFELSLHPSVDVSVEDGMVKVKSNPDAGYCRNGSGSKLIKAITGTTRARISNMIHGVANLFERKLLLVGVGYKAQSKGKTLGLTLGYSHPIDFEVPEGITIETPTPTEIIVKGIDKDLVGLVSSKIRSYRAPEPYKGKGIKYSDEKIVRKETKKK